MVVAIIKSGEEKRRCGSSGQCCLTQVLATPGQYRTYSSQNANLTTFAAINRSPPIRLWDFSQNIGFDSRSAYGKFLGQLNEKH